MLAVVSGASRGIGAAIALALARSGYTVAGLARTAAPPGITHVQCDLENRESIDAALKRVESLGKPRVLVNAAGVNFDALLVRARREHIEQMLSVNLHGAISLTQGIVKQMLAAQHGGAILSIGSVVGQQGNKGQAIYAASKSALNGFTLSLAKELASRRITVNVLAPGFVKTEMTAELSDLDSRVPLGRVCTPEEIADAALWILKTPMMTGQIISLDGGLHL
jgi:NAD(P)-dependent dehydrogenase (short-subunit alcohol dehydrogenase family)